MLLEENKSSALKQQCDYTSKVHLELQENMKVIRKREVALKEEASRATAELAQLKLKYEDTVAMLEKQKAMQEEVARDVQLCISKELDEYRRMGQRANLELQSTQDELDSLRRCYDEFKARVSGHEELRGKHELQTLSLKVANERIRELESQLNSYSDWKEVTKVSQKRLASVPDMQIELERLRGQNQRLNALIGDKLLLEEQVNDYKKRLDREEGVRAEAATLQVKLANVEQELKEWVKVAQDHCLANTLVSPMALRSRIEQLLKDDIAQVAQKSSSKSDAKHLQVRTLYYLLKRGN